MVEINIEVVPDIDLLAPVNLYEAVLELNTHCWLNLPAMVICELILLFQKTIIGNITVKVLVSIAPAEVENNNIPVEAMLAVPVTVSVETFVEPNALTSNVPFVTTRLPAIFTGSIVAPELDNIGTIPVI